MVILIFLPYPTRIVCDVLREWPYLLFLAVGFIFLLWATKYGKWWALGLVGLSCGLGYLIRPQSVQLIVYGLLWIVLSLFRPKLWEVSRWKSLIALALLLIGFAIPTVSYMRCTGMVIPYRVNRVIKTFSFNVLPDTTDEPIISTDSLSCNTAEIVSRKVLKAFGGIFKTVCENLVWFFLPAMIIGLYYRFRSNGKFEDQFLITAFVMVNVAMMVLRYCYIEPHISQRWSLALIVFTIFYIPDGLTVAGDGLKRIFPRKTLSWFSVLFLIGICICLPKLLRPIRIEKQGYREAANWIIENTAPMDIIAASDKRITFYAERKRLSYNDKIPKQAEYVVSVVEEKDGKPEFNVNLQEKYSVWINKREKKKRIVIYEVL